MVLTTVAVLAASPGPAPAASGPAMKEIGGSFIYLAGAANGTCTWGIGVVFGSFPGATSYLVEYYDGYWKQEETASIAPSQFAQDDAALKDRGAKKYLSENWGRYVHDPKLRPDNAHFVGITGGVSGSFAGPVTNCDLSAGDATEGGRFGKDLHVYAVLPSDLKREISGYVTAQKCGLATCTPVGIDGIAVHSSSGGSATTGSNGHYTIKDVEPGSWTVEIGGTYRSNPTERHVDVTGGDGRADFTICRNGDVADPSLACVPEFDYTMPERLSSTGEPTGKTKADFQPDTFSVDLKLKPNGCDPHGDYTWFLDGREIHAEKTGSCTFRIGVKQEGAYKVRVEKGATDSSAKLTYVKRVVVQDFVIASIGDSEAAGEGNPPYTDTSPVAVSLCHRSKLAYGPLAAQKVEDADPRSSVTYLDLACTGASMQGGHLEQNVETQLDRLKSLIGVRKIDALTITVGINDLDFATVLWYCWRDFACQKRPLDQNQVATAAIAKAFGKTIDVPTLADLMQNLTGALPGLYAQLRSEIRARFPSSQLSSDDVYLVGYPDPLHDQTGKLCDVLIPDSTGPAGGAIISGLIGNAVSGGGFENANAENEVSWAERSIVGPFDRVIADQASRWNVIPASAGVFDTHGYCSSSAWWVGVGGALMKGTPTSILHPNGEAQQQLSDALLGKLQPRLLPNGEARTP